MQHCLIADDHPLFREAVGQILMTQHPELQVSQAHDIVEVQRCLNTNDTIDLLLLDLHMPGAYGFSAVAFAKTHYPNIPVLVISAHEKPEVMHKAISFGAKGFLSKSAGIDEIQTAVNTVLSGKNYLPEVARSYLPPPQEEEKCNIVEAIGTLTPQQYLVVTMVARGLLNKQIAYELDVTEATIKAHLTAIFKKLGVRTRTQVAVAVSQLELDDPTPVI